MPANRDERPEYDASARAEDVCRVAHVTELDTVAALRCVRVGDRVEGPSAVGPSRGPVTPSAGSRADA
jgi:hypothetical protein